MSADDLYDNLRSYLRVTARVVDRTGQDINEGERFTLRVTGLNTAYSPNYVGQPRIVFDNPRVFVQGTSYARPVAGNAWHNLPDSELFPGESSSVTLEMEAIDEMSNDFLDFFLQEDIADIWIRADLDQNRFFEIWNFLAARQEIEPT